MSPKKQDNHKKGSDQRGGDEKQAKSLTREGFLKMLKKISRPLDEKSEKGKSKTSE